MIKKISLPRLLTLFTLLVNISSCHGSLKNIGKSELTTHFFSKKNSTIQNLMNDKKIDHRPEFYQKFTLRMSIRPKKNIKKFTMDINSEKDISPEKKHLSKLISDILYPSKIIFYKNAKEPKRFKSTYITEEKVENWNIDITGEKVENWNIEKNGNISINKKTTKDHESYLLNNEYFEAKLSIGGIINKSRSLISHSRHALLTAWYKENTKEDKPDKKTWQYRHNLTLEQSAFCVALQHKYFEKNINKGTRVAIAPNTYAYNIFFSLPMEIQDEITNDLEWIKLPILKRLHSLFWRYKMKLLTFPIIIKNTF